MIKYLIEKEFKAVAPQLLPAEVDIYLPLHDYASYALGGQS